MTNNYAQGTKEHWARVILTGNKQCKVVIDNHEYLCVVPTSIQSSTNPFVVGDWVHIHLNAEGMGLVKHVKDRQNLFLRGNRKGQGSKIPVAANIDLVLIMVDADYLLNQSSFVDAGLLAAHRYNMEALICVSKVDRLKPDKRLLLEERIAIYSRLGKSIYQYSALTGEGVTEITSAVANKAALLIGDRGAGKTSLIQALQHNVNESPGHKDLLSIGKPNKTASTQAISLVKLNDQTCLIDTPGFRDLALVDVNQAELEIVFPEITESASNCYFKDCTHVHEQGCSVLQGVQNNLVDKARYLSYRSFSTSDQRETRKVKKTEVDYRRNPCQESFACQKCGLLVVPDGAGTQHRNHCPHCLTSLHVDDKPGDRRSLCRGMMEPIGVWVRKNGEWAVIHRCNECGELSSNRIAADDNPLLLMSLAVKPLSAPPFPLDRVLASHT